MGTSNHILLEPEHINAIHSLAEESNHPVEEVTELYAGALGNLRSGALIQDYLIVLTCKKVRGMLRQTKGAHFFGDMDRGNDQCCPAYLINKKIFMPETLVMCTPVGFAVNYEINPWMRHQIGHVSPKLADAQWRGLFDKLSALADVKLMRGDPAWPDLVFTANAGLPLPREKKFILSNFKHPQRQGEKAINRDWFDGAGWTCIDLPECAVFEGAGDALFDSAGRLWVGGGPRSDESTPAHLARHITTPIHRLELIDPRFYHLDTCFCPLPDGYALYLPSAFDEASHDLLARSFGDKLISLTPEEGQQFCANAVCVERVLLMNQATPRLKKLLGGLGFSVMETPLSEFRKSGGSAKCLTLSIEGWATR